MTVSALYSELKAASRREAAGFEISQLFDLHFGRGARLLHPGQAVPEEAEAAVRGDCARLEGGYPLQYILGEWDFYGLTLKVGEGVLIPRADTEVSVETALGLLDGSAAPAIADLCAGSGAIALALAKNLPRCRIFAVELYDGACRYLCENIERLDKRRRVKAVKADVLDNIADILPPGLDMVISNPPYIAAGEMGALPAEVKHEPETALFGGEDGLKFYRAISKSAGDLLKPGGWLVFEAGWRQAAGVAAIMGENGFERISAAKDMGGIDRCIYGRKPL